MSNKIQPIQSALALSTTYGLVDLPNQTWLVNELASGAVT